MTFPGVDENIVAEAAMATSHVAASAPDNPYAVKAWGPQHVRNEFDVTCPSGQRCRARSLELEDAIALGVLDALDMFTPTIMKDVVGQGKSSSEEQNASVLSSLSDPEKRANFFGVVNKVVAHTVVIPRVVLVDDGNLPEGVIFANDVPFADKMHIFREVFSGRGDALQSFRDGQTGDVAPVAEESGVQMPTE